MPAISSTAITWADYNDAKQELYLTFTSGGTYTYYAVPTRIYDGLLAASSAGRFYNDFIRDKYLDNASR